MVSTLHTAAIFAWRDGGMGVDAIGLRLARRPATEREEAGALRMGAAWGRARVASGGAGESDIVVDGEDAGEGKTQGALTTLGEPGNRVPSHHGHAV